VAKSKEALLKKRNKLLEENFNHKEQAVRGDKISKKILIFWLFLV
jgi:hypothetical protein